MTVLIPNHRDDALISRRSIFIGAAASLLCAPAIVRATSLMPVRSLMLPTMEQLYPGRQYAGFVDRLRYSWLESALKSGWDECQRRGSPCPNLSKAQATKTVAYARHFGFLPKPKDGFYVEA